MIRTAVRINLFTGHPYQPHPKPTLKDRATIADRVTDKILLFVESIINGIGGEVCIKKVAHFAPEFASKQGGAICSGFSCQGGQYAPDSVVRGVNMLRIILEYLEHRGQMQYGPDFKIQKEDHDILLKLLAYAVRDEKVCCSFDIDLRKGIILSGPVGCGKTSLISLIRDFFPAFYRYNVIPCSGLVFEFSELGYPLIKRFSTFSFKSQPHNDRPQHICFDDLGTEPEGRHYGLPCNVMAEILIARYKYFHSHGMITHITTNLSSGEIEHRYGARVRSRLREVCNLIAFDAHAGDKRR